MKRVLLASTLLVAGCDWELYATLNSLPVEGDPDKNPVVHVFLGVDGLPYDVVAEAMTELNDEERGNFDLAESIAIFPATSDAAWTRVVRTAPFHGYEHSYYDSKSDELKNGGLGGLIGHAIPAFESLGIEKNAYYDVFDFYANGYLDTLTAYQSTTLALYDSLDAIFFMLDQQAEFAPSFSAYLVELDVYGHMESHDDVKAGFKKLMRRIKTFKETHTKRKFVFTIASDHGMDNVEALPEHLVDFAEVLPKLGIQVVDKLKGHPDNGPLVALPIMHTRVSYLSLHTKPAMAERIAEKVASHVSVDLAFARSTAPHDFVGGENLSWFSAYQDGKLLVRFGYDVQSDMYALPAGANYAALGFALEFPEGVAYRMVDDADLFAATVDAGIYPDFFYRARTGLVSVATIDPADVLISFRRPYASMGFKMPGGANEIASAGFHGGMDRGSSSGVMLTEERDLPEAVRADQLLDLIPSVRQHFERRGVELFAGEPGGEL